MEQKIKCVYKITNNINGKIYVGQTSDLHRRWIWHKNQANKGRIDYRKNIKIPLYFDIDKYGKDNFSIEVLEEIDDKETRLQREIFWIEKLGSLEPNGYNKSRGGNLNKPKKISEDELGDIIAMLQQHKSAKEIKAKHGISIQFITDINVGRYRRKKELVYPIRAHYSAYYQHDANFKKCSICGTPIYSKEGMCKKCRLSYDEKRIYGKAGDELALEIQGFLLQKMSKEQIGRFYGVTSAAISKKIKKYGLVEQQ